MLAPYSQPAHPIPQQPPNNNLSAPRPYYQNYPPAPNPSYLPPSSSPPPTWPGAPNPSASSSSAVPPLPAPAIYGNVSAQQNNINATQQPHPSYPQGFRYPSTGPQLHVPPNATGALIPSPASAHYQQQRYGAAPPPLSQQTQQPPPQPFPQKLQSMSGMYPSYGGEVPGSGVMMPVGPSGYSTATPYGNTLTVTNAAQQQQANPGATRMPIMSQQHSAMNAPYPAYYDANMPPPPMGMNMNMNMGMGVPMAAPYPYPVDYMGFPPHMLPQGGPFSPFTSRVSCACSNCKKAKTRCDSARPCGRCKRLGREHSCVDSVHQRRGRSVQTNSTFATNQRKRTSRDEDDDEEDEDHEEDDDGNPSAEEEEDVHHNPAKGPNKVRVTAGGHDSERASPSVAPVPTIAAPIVVSSGSLGIPNPVNKSPSLSFADQANRQAMENSETTTFRANVALPGSGSASSLSLLSYLSSPSSSFTPSSFPSTPAYNAALVNKGVGEHSGNSSSQLTPTMSATGFRGDFANVTQSAPVSKRRLVSPACLSSSTQQSPVHVSPPAASTRLKTPQPLRASGSDVSLPDTSSLAYDRAMKAQTSLVSQSEPTSISTVADLHTLQQSQQHAASIDNSIPHETQTSHSTPTPNSSASPSGERSNYSSSASSTGSTASFSAFTGSSSESVPTLGALDVNSKSDSDGATESKAEATPVTAASAASQ